MRWQSKANGIFAEDIQSNRLYEMRRFVHKSVLFVVIFIISTARGFAQSDTPEREFAQVFFRQGATTIDTSYRDNEASLRRFVDVVNECRKDSTFNIGAVRIVASVSPEGLNAVNERIIRQRAESIVAWINQHADQPIDYIVEFKGVDWELLISLIEQRKESRYLPYRDEVLDLLRNTPEEVEGKQLDYNWRYAKLSKLHDGTPYIWLKKYLFPELRYATAELVISFDVVAEESTPEIAQSETKVVVETVETPVRTENIEINKSSISEASGESQNSDFTPEDEGFISPPPVQSEEILTNLCGEKSGAFCMALKTNMLYLLAAVPNLGAEVHMGGGWSFVANWQYAWWSSDAACWYHRIYGGDVALRKWFGRRAAEQPLAGHHVGIYGQMFTYDFIFGEDRIGQLADKWSYGAGVEYGYSVPVGKALRFDFTLGVGYLTGLYKRYKLEDDCYVWQDTRKRNYLGPTKAEISFVWVIGGKKGGCR